MMAGVNGAMRNSSGQNLEAMVTKDGGGGMIPNEPAVIQVNFGIRPRHIWAMIAAVPATMTALAGIDWLYVPAKRDDLIALEVTTKILQQDVGGLKDSTKSLAEAVERLNQTLLRPNRSRPRSRVAPTPPTR